MAEKDYVPDADLTGMRQPSAAEVADMTVPESEFADEFADD